MMEGGLVGSPQIFVVDSQPPVAPRPREVKHGFSRKREYILYLLVGMALLGVVIEAAFIYHLYRPPTAVQAISEKHHKPSAEKITGDDDSGAESNDIHPARDENPDKEKPAAFLLGAGKTVDEDGVMQWQTQGLGSFLNGVGYENGNLKIQTSGYYYIYSKVYFSESCNLFTHQINWRTSLYGEKTPTMLMRANRFSCGRGEKSGMRSADVENSFLGGVFKLYRNDSVFVQVNSSSSVRPGVQDNFFGIFMI